MNIFYRNRFNRVNANSINLTRHSITSATMLNRNSDNSTQSNSNSNSIENLNRLNENEQPPPPTLVVSPLAYTSGQPASPTPLLLTTNNNNSNTGTTYQEFFVPNSSLSNNGISCVKKRVWTPVQSTARNGEQNAAINSSNLSDVRIVLDFLCSFKF